MFVRTTRLSGPKRRRGIVLVLILAMLGLLALIGVTFATFSSQSQVAARNYAAKMNQPDADRVLDFALAQLIYDTDNPASALHGHSLVRDMYGNDTQNHGVLAYLPTNGLQLTITGAQNNAPYWTITTNIPEGGHPSLYGANFTRWTMRLDSTYSAQTLEIITDTIANGYHVFTTPMPITASFPTNFPTVPLTYQNMQQPVVGATFKLDGRYQRAFNGPGLSPISIPLNGYNYTAAMFGNFLFGQAAVTLGGLSSYFSPDVVGMDEDYDAVDTENWFLAAQNGDGSINVPSFHRPGMLTKDVWTNGPTDTPLDLAIKRAMILRPRAADHPAAGQATFPDLVPDATTGKITYDVDNDGDGITDAVWLDLGYPPQRDASGKLYKPLFALTVVGLNGRLPLNTVGNLNGRTNVDSPEVAAAVPAIHDIGRPTLDHVSGHGYTTSEINPKYALDLDPANLGDGNGLDQLRRLLQGNVTPNTHVDGRWGEGDQLVIANASGGTLPFPRPGRSANLGGSDDNFDGVDHIPHENLTVTPPIYPEQYNLLDAAGAFQLPSERMRLGVVPIDTTGNGFLVDWTNVPSLLSRAFGSANFGSGFDKWGRAGYYMYYRPPGRPLAVPNVLHSWEAHRYPPDNATNGGATREFWGAMPFNNGGTTGLPGTGRAGYASTFPTFVGDINAQIPPQAISGGTPDATSIFGLLPGVNVNPNLATVYSSQIGAGTLMRDDPTEVNLYQPNQLDELFSYPDLEWLYRAQDVDGSSLQSRLADLLPDVFTGTGSQERRKKFSLESWDTIDFAWSTDNPGNSFPYNANFLQNTNASFRSYNLLTSFTPPLAARGRRINLNQPLPISSDPFEPTRLRWITDAYQTFKAALPPKAKDSAVELAAIGQFCVNMIDFRDPDDTITIWTNPDLIQTAATPSTYSELTVSIGSGTFVQYGMEYLPVAINEAIAFSTKRIETPESKTMAKAVDSRRFLVELINMNTEDRGSNNNGTAADLGLNGWDIVVLPDTSAMNRPDPITGQIGANVTLSHYTPDPMDPTKPAPFNTAYLGYDTTNKTHQVLGPSDPAQPRKPIPALNESGANDPSYYVVGYNEVNPNDETHDPTPDSVLEGNANDLLPDVVAQAQYLWIYLRRPANPYDDTSPYVVVDSMRIPMADAGGTLGTPIFDTMTQRYQVATTGTQALYSTERLQPYRGGQAVPPQMAGTTPITNAMVPRYAYGYSEQTKPCADVKYDADPTKDKSWKGQFNKYTNGTDANTANKPLTDEIHHTLGSRNDRGGGSGLGIDENWSPFIFHDRDYASVAELLLVPGCSPGLFTKQFVERGGPIYPAAKTCVGSDFPFVTPPTQRPRNGTTLAAGPYDYQTPTMPSQGQFVGVPLNPALSSGFTPMPPTIDLPVYPYLPDNFYYTAASTNYGTAASPITDMNGTNTAPDPIIDIGGPNGAGWHRALEFFEVPSPMIGAIGPVAEGENRDWMRKDLRPGLLNLNLIYDQEVYLGLLDDPRLNASTASGTNSHLPRVVTEVNANGYPTKWSDVTGVTNGSFSDFLKLRHGGSGFLFAFGGGPAGSGSAAAVGDNTYINQNVAAERPFRSLSFPDINYTILRPATLEPANPQFLASYPTTMNLQAKASPTLVQLNSDLDPFQYDAGAGMAYYYGNPGMKNPFLSRYLQDTDSTRSQFAQTQAETAPRPTSVVQPPPIPPRRLFEPADYVNTVPAVVTGVGPDFDGTYLMETSNASVTGDLRVNNPAGSQGLSNIAMDLFVPDALAANTPPAIPASFDSRVPLSAKLGIARKDLRRHPLYRTEMLQKMMNLTTVRTHQYAVWVTVGFFEVVSPGNPQLAKVNPIEAIDKLGPEVGKAHGENVRYRGFFLLDRTRATGFSPANPGDFRDLIVHRRRIE